MAETRVGTYEAKTHLSEYLERVRNGERVVIERHGKPVAALVSTDDLEKLEGSLEDQEARWRRALEDDGIRITSPTRKAVPRERRRLIEIKGKPLSEQIVEDRR